MGFFKHGCNFWVRIIEIVRYRDCAIARPGSYASLFPARMFYHKRGDRGAIFGEDDAFAVLDARYQFREVCFGFKHVYDGCVGTVHTPSLA